VDYRKVQIALWAVLLTLQVFLLTSLAFPLLVQSRIETEGLEYFDMSNTFSKRLAVNGQLSVNEQNKLLALAKDYEQIIRAHSNLEASMANEVLGLYGWLMVFVAITLVVQILLAVVSLKRPSRGGGTNLVRD
jgi:hypothetical protein